MSNQLAKAYEAKLFEDDIYQYWEMSGFFNPDTCITKGVTKASAKTYTIILPPPNVTGKLHLGHASMLAYEDLMIRYQRLKGKQVLWIPGTDHAAIATQTRVEKLISEEGLDRHVLGREKFLSRVKKYVESSKNTIHKQIRKMGSSLDWSREKYTLDKDVSKVVYTVFENMYKDGLIYRGNRIVNWCPRCHSTLADDEVEYKEQKTPFYYFKYGPVVIGTARPETKFADKVIIVHPDDKRYLDIVGKKFTVPWIEGDVEARVIADKQVEMDMGTGAMTITPAHSFVDFELAQKYDLEVKKIIDEEGKLTEAAGKFVGMNAHEARKKIVAKMQKQGLVEKIDEEYVHNLSVCYRCGTPIEPLPSKQWFVDVNKKIPKFDKSLKELSLEAVKTGLDGDKQKQIEIVPEKFNKTYFHWMDNLRDWCISRQIWWGHRIPVYYRKQENPKSNPATAELSPKQTQNQKSKIQDEEIYVGVNPPAGDDWVQDEDTLDTWFSSALWTFSTLGWPDGKDFKKFHPTQILETGYDIIFFWVARMILMTIYTTNQIPFEKVYLHGLVRDRNGKKMSKSLGNGIDPIKMIEKYGADSLRLSMLIGTSAGSDIKLYEEKISGYRNFVNKLWNISRFILMNIVKAEISNIKPSTKTLADKWILSKFDLLNYEVSKAIDEFNFSRAGELLYEFTWSKLADWYLEIVKIEKNKNDILNYLLQNLLIMWHPFTPFVTEAIWFKGYNQGNIDKQMIMVQKWPQVSPIKDKASVSQFSLVQNLIIGIRSLRAESKISPTDIFSVKVISEKNKKLFIESKVIIERLARVKLVIVDTKPIGDFLQKVENSFEIFVEISGQAKQKQIEEKKQLTKYIIALEKKLINKNFTSKAPGSVVKSEQEKLRQAKNKISKL